MKQYLNLKTKKKLRKCKVNLIWNWIIENKIQKILKKWSAINMKRVKN